MSASSNPRTHRVLRVTVSSCGSTVTRWVPHYATAHANICRDVPEGSLERTNMVKRNTY